MDLAKRIADLPPEKRDQLLRRLREQQGVARPGSSPPRLAAGQPDRHAPFPLTDIQQVYWTGRSGLFELGACGSNVYTEYEIVVDHAELVEPFVAQFNLALQRLIQRHDMLRMVVLPDGRQQILHEAPPYTMRVVDLRDLDQPAIEAAVAAVRERMSTEQGPITRWPLFEFMAHRMDGRRLLIHIRVDALLTDGTSRKIFLLDLFRYLADPGAPLPPLGCSYLDYAQAWAQMRESEPYRRSREYWMGRLPTLPPAPQLPQALRLRPEMSPRFVSHVLPLLDEHAWGRLKARAARLGLTPSGVTIAAYAEIVAIWSRSPHFTISLIGSYRPPIHPDIVNIVGNFNTFHLLEVARDPGGFAARARHLQERMTKDLDHLLFSGPQVLRELNRRRRSGARAAAPILFNSVIEYSHPSYHREMSGGGATGGGGSTYEEIDLGLFIPQVLIMPNVLESDDGSLYGKWYAVEDAFPDGMMEDMFGAYARLLRALAADEASWEEHRYQTIERVLPQQMQQLRAINATGASVPTETLDALVAAQAARRPDQPAVIAAGRQLTYAELDHQAGRVAGHLRAVGVERGAVVGIVARPGWQAIVAALGVLRAGAAYLPIDSGLPSARLADELAKAGVRLVLSGPENAAPREWPGAIEHLDVAALLAPDAGLAAAAPTPSARPDDLAYIIPTAGATAYPRRAMVEHRAVVNTILDVNRRLAVGPGDRALALAPLDSDLSIYEIFGTLAAGGTIVCPAAVDARDPGRLAALLAHAGVTLWVSPPALLELLAQHLAARGEALPRTLRLALLSRDWIPLRLPDRLRALSPDLRMVALGGVTEAGIWSGMSLIDAVAPSWGSIPYGRPLANQRLYILNEDFEPRPVWVPGQLYIGGLGLARGYWRDEQATREHFVVHPRTGERLFHTGDIARLLPDGQVELLGRAADFQVESYGYAVEPRQIEAALERHPAIRQAAVLADAARAGLVAYLVQGSGVRGQGSGVAEQERSINPGSLIPDPRSLIPELRAFLQAQLPSYMVPSAFVALPAMPLTPGGRVDRRALPAHAPAPEEDGAAPDEALEQQLAQLWEELLDTGPVGADDDFFERGGSSLSMARLLNRLQETFGPLRVPPLFWYQPTIRNLARIVGQHRHATERPSGEEHLLTTERRIL